MTSKVRACEAVSPTLLKKHLKNKKNTSEEEKKIFEKKKKKKNLKKEKKRNTYKRTLNEPPTFNVEMEGLARGVPHPVEGVAGVGPCLGAPDRLQH